LFITPLRHDDAAYAPLIMLRLMAFLLRDACFELRRHALLLDFFAYTLAADARCHAATPPLFIHEHIARHALMIRAQDAMPSATATPTPDG